jgi:hypothetical protein
VSGRELSVSARQLRLEMIITFAVAFPYLVVAYYFIAVNNAAVSLSMAIPFGIAVILLNRRWKGLVRRSSSE